tara:strand:+ start:625 stop:2943 length:2319 start_codon:yes stop_codon:yes gene_type:complete
MKYYLFPIILSFFIKIAYTQEAQLIDRDNFDQLLMENLLHKSINSTRKENKLHALTRLETLDAAAFDQAEYNQKNNKDGHDQTNNDKKDVKLRVRSYGGLHYEMGEVIYTASIGVPIKTSPGTPPITISTYEQAAKVAVNEWLKDDDSKSIILDNSYYTIGTAASFNYERDEIAIIAVIASAQFDLKGEKDRKKNYSLKEYNKPTCDLFNRTNPFLPELLSDKVGLDGNTIYLDNSDRELLSEILNGGKDGFTIDLVSSDQFNCLNGNQLYPSNYNYGLLLEPTKAATLNYKSHEGNYLERIKLGTLPNSFDPKNTNINLLVVKDDAVCNYIPYNITDAKNLHWIEPEWEIKTTNSSTGTILTFKEFLSRNTDQIIEYINSLEEEKERIESLKITYNYSPILTDTLSLIENEIKKAIIPFSQKSTLLFTNRYEEINKYISNKPIALELRGLSETEKLRILKASTEEDFKIYLKSIHSTKITIGKVENLDLVSSQELTNAYKASIQEGNTKSAINLQSVLIKRSILGDNFAKNTLITTRVDQTEANLTLISNALVSKIKFATNATLSERETLRKALLGLYLVDKSNEVVAYNLCLSILYAWELENKAPVTPEKWEEYFQSASSNNVISSEQLKRLSTNFHLLSADYYYNKGEIRERKKSLEAAFSNIMSSENTSTETIMYAQYFMFQLQIKWAAEILQKELKDSFDLAIAEQLVSIASYPSSEISNVEISELLIKISQSNSSRFCELFKSNKAHYLYLKDDGVKKQWCHHCKN